MVFRLGGLLRIHDEVFLVSWVSLLVAVAFADRAATLPAPLETAQYHLSFVAIPFRNIRNQPR
jgi:hypothetical protein